MKETIAGRLDRRGNFHWGDGFKAKASFGRPNAGVRVKVAIGATVYGGYVARAHVGAVTLQQVRA